MKGARSALGLKKQSTGVRSYFGDWGRPFKATVTSSGLQDYKVHGLGLKVLEEAVAAMGRGSALPEGLAIPAQRAFAGADIVRLEQLTKIPVRDILILNGVGPTALAILLRSLAVKGLSFPKVPGGEEEESIRKSLPRWINFFRFGEFYLGAVNIWIGSMYNTPSDD